MSRGPQRRFISYISCPCVAGHISRTGFVSCIHLERCILRETTGPFVKIFWSKDTMSL